MWQFTVTLKREKADTKSFYCRLQTSLCMYEYHSNIANTLCWRDNASDLDKSGKISWEQRHENKDGQTERISGFIVETLKGHFLANTLQKKVSFLNEVDSVVLCTWE